MESIDGNTHVETIRDWRQRGLDAKFIYDLTHGEGESGVKTADALVAYLTQGSPAVRLVFQELLAIKALERVDKRAYGHHQKLIVGEVVPANAFYLQEVLRACLIDARVFHADLSHQGKSQMVDLFNDPQSSLTVLIMMYDVAAVGLNLHKACNRVLITSLPRSRAQESQLAGRALRITSEFPLTVVRRYTPDSHDQFRGARQAEKAALQLAANAHDPSIKALVVDLLNEFQKEVDKCHEDPEMKDLVTAIKNHTLIDYFDRQAATCSNNFATSCPDIPADTSSSFTAVSASNNQAANPCPNSSTGEPTNIIPPLPGSHDCQTPNLPGTRKLRDRKQANTYSNLGDDESGVEDEDDDKNDQDFYDDGSGSDDDDSLRDVNVADDEDLLLSQSSESETVTQEEPQEFTRYIRDVQPDDVLRHKITLLRQSPPVVWTEKDLENEDNLILGLRLLYNKMNGAEMMHLTKSIHIMYKQFPQWMINQMAKVRDPSARKKKTAKRRA
ncbi:hypothetical protein BJX61DRAFT_490486 [Aspergillus egyptiacus]|nr:hypothetical protein BJX61DRAFT_490486 [Aspergillus egyptiacus]